MIDPTELLALRNLRSTAMRVARDQAGIDKPEMQRRTGLSRMTIDSIEKNRSGWGVDVEIIYLHALQLVTFEPVWGEENGKAVIIRMVLVPKK